MRETEDEKGREKKAEGEDHRETLKTPCRG